MRVMRPNAWNISETHFNNNNSKVRGLRPDLLAQILSYGNIKSDSKVIVVDNCMGIISCSILERLGHNGVLLSGYDGQQPSLGAKEWFNFSKLINFHSNIFH